MNNEHQSESSATGQFLRFCWLRETAPGHLEQDGGLRIAKSDLLEALFGIHPGQKRTSAEPPVAIGEVLATLSIAAPFDSYPQWARRRLANILGPLACEEQRREAARNAGVLMDVASRILAVTPPDLEVEVHLPYISRRYWASRFQILDSTEFVFSDGRVVPTALLSTEQRDGYNAQLIAASSISAAFDARHSFSHSRPVASGLVETTLPVRNVPEPPAPGGEQEVAVRMTLASSACRAWNSAPIEKSGAYFPIHAAVSVAVQDSLRRGLAWHWLSDLNNYDDTLATFTVLAYACSQPFPGRRRTDFTYDILTTDWMYFAFRCARRPVRTMLKSIRAALIAAGKPELAEQYHPEQAKFILQRIRKQRKSIQALIATEGEIVNFILRFGLQLQAGKDIVTAVHDAPEFMRGLASRLRRLFRERDLTWMAPMLLIEATNALSTALGAESAIRADVSVSPRPADCAPLPVLQQSHPVPCEW